MGNTEANHNSSEMKAVKSLYSTESAWWNSLFSPPRDSVKNSPVWGIREQTHFMPRKEQKSKSMLLHFSRSAHCSKPRSLTQHQQNQPSLVWCKQPGQRTSIQPCSRVLPIPHTCSWTRMERQKDRWTQRTGEKESRTSILIYKCEFWPSRGKWLTDKRLKQH